MAERFRLIYLKSPVTEEYPSEEPHPKESKLNQDIETPKISKNIEELYSFQIILNQAKADLKHPDPNVKILAIKFLEKSQPFVSIPLLEEILNDQNPGVRAHALNALIKFKPPKIQQFLKKYLRDNAPEVRLTALRGIFHVFEEIDLNLFMQLLDDESPIVRQKLATLLGWTQIKGILPILAELSKDKDPNVRKAALFSLLTQYPEESEERILNALNDPDTEIRSWAKAMIEKIIKTPIKRERNKY